MQWTRLPRTLVQLLRAILRWTAGSHAVDAPSSGVHNTCSGTEQRREDVRSAGGANMNGGNKMKVFSGRANIPLAEKIARYLDDAPGKITLDNFPDGEISVRIEEDVRGRDVFLVQSTCPPVNDNLMELLIMIDSFKRASAARITAVLPYYGYARQDRKDQGRVPITAKLVADILTRSGADRVLALDLHAAQIQGFFDIPVDHLHGAPVI